MTEFEVASAIRNYVTSNEGVTNFSLSLEQIIDEMNTLRSRMMGKLDESGAFRRPFMGYTQKATLTVQKFGNDSPYKGISYVTIPKLFVTIHGLPAIAYVGGTNRTSPYYVITGAEHGNNLKDSFTGSNRPTAEYDEAGLIIRIRSGGIATNKLYFEGVLEKPADFDVHGYDDGRDDPTKGSPYPMPQGPLDELIGKMVKSYLGTMYRVPVQPNTQSDVPRQPQQQQ